MSDTVHVFEKAGLGVAPFRFVRMEHKVGPIRSFDSASGVEIQVGAPGQPMGTCQYCGTGIAFLYYIRDVNGKEFYVGSECVKRTGDAGLERQIAPVLRQMRHDRERVRIQVTKARLALPEIRAKLAALPHPHEGLAKKGKTLYDWAEWMLKMAGNAGMIRVARIVEKL